MGQKITDIKRQGKVLQLELSSGEWLLIHLKMTGQLIARTADNKMLGGGHPTNLTILPDKTTRLVFHLSDSVTLFFNDIRIFGWVHWHTNETRAKVLAVLGPDALDGNFTEDNLQTYITRYPRRLVKQLLLDQGLLAGVGNIYADEIAFLAKLNPNRRLQSLGPDDIKKLFDSIKPIISEAVKYRGTTFRNFVDGSGNKGNYVSKLQAYGRAGEECLNSCGQRLVKDVVVGRGTSYCPSCQK